MQTLVASPQLVESVTLALADARAVYADDETDAGASGWVCSSAANAHMPAEVVLAMGGVDQRVHLAHATVLPDGACHVCT